MLSRIWLAGVIKKGSNMLNTDLESIRAEGRLVDAVVKRLRSRLHARGVLLFATLFLFGALAAQAAVPSGLDLNGDAKADVVVQDANGSARALVMNGAAVQSSTTIISAGSGWKVSQFGDLNGDGKADLILQATDGSLYMLLMNGTTVSNGAFLTSGGSWALQAVADLNGDNKSDLVLRHSDGSLYLLLMNGTTVLSGAYLTSGSAWSAEVVADLNGDGKSDIVLRHADGSLYTLLMNGTGATSGAYLTSGNAWSLAGTADFNADGKSDLVLRYLDGSLYALLMNGSAVASGAYLTTGAAWGIRGFGDLNGDGRADVFLQHLDGSHYALLLNGTAVAGGAYLTAGSRWSLETVADFNGDGKVDVLWQQPDGTLSITIMNGISQVSTGTVSAVSNQLVVPNGNGLKFSAALVDAARLLTQTTFGATRDEIVRVAGIGPQVYLNEQFAAQQTNHVNTVLADPKYPSEPWSVLMPSVWKQYFEGNDQLRQRVSYALSQIIVVSRNNNTLGDQACSIAGHIDILGRHAFGNFRDILKDVTLNPAMGLYLDMKQSSKADPVLNSVANENYARELLQLFSIGTVMLNQDGSVQFANGKAVDTYSEETVREFARALTGWTFANQDQTKPWRWLYPDVPYPSDTNAAKACTAWTAPMQPWTASYRSGDDKRTLTGGPHDAGAKTLLSYPNAVKRDLPAGQTPQKDVEDVIDNVFNHPNVGPFIGEQLIQRLVTSNPSGAYVSRVAAAFNNNGAGVRGDMKAVIRAILLDPEARLLPRNQATTYGKLREPVLRFTHLHRAFGARMLGGSYRSIYDLSGAIGQSPHNAPSVFNFYHPDYTPSGVMMQAGLYGPEFEITNSATLSSFMDFSKWAIVGGFGRNSSNPNEPNWLKPNYDYYTALSSNPAAMVDDLNLVLMGGSMSPQFRTQLVDVVTKLTDSNATNQATERFNTAFWLIMNSPEYSIQK
jgi:uncharacterized protein (DUF1800 family)